MLANAPVCLAMAKIVQPTQPQAKTSNTTVSPANTAERTLLSALSDKIGVGFTTADEVRVQEALEYNQTGQVSEWNDDAHGAELTVTPTHSFKTHDNALCRGYKILLLRGAKRIGANDTACRHADSVWRVDQPNRIAVTVSEAVAPKLAEVNEPAPVVAKAEPLPASPKVITAATAIPVKPMPAKPIPVAKPTSAKPVSPKGVPAPAKVITSKPTPAPVKPEPQTVNTAAAKIPSSNRVDEKGSVYVSADTDLSTVNVIRNAANVVGAAYASTDTNVATVDSNGKVTITGTGTIIVTRAGNRNFNASIDSYTLAVVRIDQTDFTIGDDVAKTFGDGIFRRSATGGQGQGEVSYDSSDSSDPEVATVNPSTGEVVVLNAGETTITATKLGDDTFNEISDSYEVVVARANRSIFDVGNNVRKTYSDGTFVKPVTGTQ